MRSGVDLDDCVGMLCSLTMGGWVAVSPTLVLHVH